MRYWCVLLSVLAPAGVSNAHPLVVQAPHSTSTPAVTVIPEYERVLRRVLIAIPEGQLDGRTGPRRDNEISSVDPAFIKAVYAELLASLPAYSVVGIIARSTDQDILFGWSQLFDTRDNIHLHFIRTPEDEVDMWTQDLGEFIGVDGEDRFLVSGLPHRKMADARRIAEARRGVARTIFSEDMVVTADFFFEAGNLLFDHARGGRLRVLVGEDVVTGTIESARLDGRRLSELEVAEWISLGFGGAEAVVLRGEQGGGLIHIDQAFTVLRGGKIVLKSVAEEDSPEGKLLSGYRDQLEFLGYEILDLPTTLDDIRGYRASTNALPFTHLETREDMVIFPVFPGEVSDGAPVRLQSKHLTGKAAAAYAVYEHAGYEPIPVRDVAHIAGGNTHCVANVLE